jgi:cytochrome c
MRCGVRLASTTVGAALAGLGAVLALIGAVAGAERATAAPPSEARGRLLFLRCASCHDISTSPSAKTGPNLAGVFNRRAGGLAGYAYSPAMKAQTFNWDEAHLNRWLTRPTDVVPGTAMAFAGIPSATDRAALIAYLRHPTP